MGEGGSSAATAVSRLACRPPRRADCGSGAVKDSVEVDVHEEGADAPHADLVGAAAAVVERRDVVVALELLAVVVAHNLQRLHELSGRPHDLRRAARDRPPPRVPAPI